VRVDRIKLVLKGGRVVVDRFEDPPVRVDIAINEEGRIARIAPHVECEGAEVWDLGGLLVLPGLVDIHQHLDKTRTARYADNPSGTLAGAIEVFSAYAMRASQEDIAERAHRTIEACIARGTVGIRSHANVDHKWGLGAVKALVELRSRMQDRIRLQVVAFLSGGALGVSISEAGRLAEEALDEGADAIGGAPDFSEHPEEFIDMLFDVAVRHGCPLDLHVDETLNPEARLLAHVARRTIERGLEGQVVVSHCCSLSAMPPGAALAIVELVARARVGVVTLPATNLFLQGREAPLLPPRGLTRIRELLEAGVPVAYASDNIQDPFNPVGTGDLLEVGRWMFLSAQLPSELLPYVYAMGSTVPAQLMRLGEDYGMREGAYADLLILDAKDAADAIASGPLNRTVLFHGRHVAGPSYRDPLSNGRSLE
jgi:cytosine deaminase